MIYDANDNLHWVLKLPYSKFGDFNSYLKKKKIIDLIKLTVNAYCWALFILPIASKLALQYKELINTNQSLF